MSDDLDQLFYRALEQSTCAERDAFLHELFRERPDVKTRLEGLLAADADLHWLAERERATPNTGLEPAREAVSVATSSSR
ncbi:MAG: hypothetical protein GY711_19435 [bacterium]|nr:hypothetical protein [bacterium]